MKHPIWTLVTWLSLALVVLGAIAWLGSCWRSAGWSHIDQTWVFPAGTGMRELHTTQQLAWIVQGEIRFSRDEMLSAVIPAGSSAAGEPAHDSAWLWQPTAPLRVRSWDSRWYVTRWNEWRLGETGLYTTTGGGSTSRVLSIPMWLAIAVVGMPCWVAAARALRVRRLGKLGRCLMCGYDRRSISSDAACPECGAAHAPAAASQPSVASDLTGSS